MQSTKSPSKPAAGRAKDAIQLLTADHKEVKALFKRYDKLAQAAQPEAERQEVARQICDMLSVHATVEEELFYPAARDVLGEDDVLLDEATVEHATARDLIAQLASAELVDAMYDAKVKVLGEYIDHHVKEEEEELFPKLRKTALDLKALGAEMAESKATMMAEIEGAEA